MKFVKHTLCLFQLLYPYLVHCFKLLLANQSLVANRLLLSHLLNCMANSYIHIVEVAFTFSPLII